MDETYESWKTRIERSASEIEEHGAVPPEFSEVEKAGPDDKIIADLEKEGWKLIDIITGAYTASAENHPEKEIKIVGQGKRHLIFERKKSDLHGEYNYE